MILGQEEVSETSEANYSKHSSLLTDLSLTPSPRLSTPVNTDKLSQPTPVDQPPPILDSGPEAEPPTQLSPVPTTEPEHDTAEPDTAKPDTAEPNTAEPSKPGCPSEDPSSTCHHQLTEDQEETEGTAAKASSINNNSRTVQDLILTCVSENITSPSYCAPSPVYSIPSPGSAFSIVISKRRDSES